MNKKELNKAYKEGLINEEKYKNELFKLETTEKPIKKAKRIYEHVPESDFIKLLNHTKKPQHKIAFVLGFASGLRISEIVGGRRSDGTIMQKLQPNDIHLKEHKIFVRQAKGRKDRITYAPKQLKEKDLKYFPLNLGKRALQTAFLRISMKAGINWQIGTYKRGVANKVDYNKDIPIYRYHFHCLRSSFVTRLLNEGVPPHHVMLLAGHESLSTTTSYAKSNPVDAIEQVMRRGL